MNFQAESKKSGDEFEAIVLSDLRYRGFSKIGKNIYIQGTGCEVDFLAEDENYVTEYVESKGGKSGDKKRPGAKRTDNVKKAIANAALLKASYPDIKYVVYFSARPNPGSYSEEMLDTAKKAGLIDSIRYLDSINNKTINDIKRENAESYQEQ